MDSFGTKWLLLGVNGYKCCLNTPNPSLALIISQMHWIVTHFDYRNTNKSIDCFEASFVGFRLFWEKMGIGLV
ncbi:hypothetical protein AT1G40090 [Arabidopsis thaliana]|uniref:Uncharacterized protein n=1 Tax=Arabidopsis thaliana TaxID=3702 RepID=A0A1P8AUT7_ARATH|nr:uncharacterized protein AT1G40090 [Arabidopsis thaliana]ANM60441.1 hypothetical protein AT1G40090 [Arabidopsis thaliana]|eukprot:NP_001322727.1 hypothetical protein AT1G40090 [Arabidopsis thaliana]